MIKVSENPRTVRTLYKKKDASGVKHDTQNEQSRAELSDTVRAKTSWEEFWFSKTSWNMHKLYVSGQKKYTVLWKNLTDTV